MKNWLRKNNLRNKHDWILGIFRERTKELLDGGVIIGQMMIPENDFYVNIQGGHPDITRRELANMARYLRGKGYYDGYSGPGDWDSWKITERGYDWALGVDGKSFWRKVLGSINNPLIQFLIFIVGTVIVLIITSAFTPFDNIIASWVSKLVGKN